MRATVPTVRVKVSGGFACWTRPESKVERVSYECMTPSAARNILDAICWKPEMRWVVTSILILNPVRFQTLRRNELQDKLAPRVVGRWMSGRAPFEPQPAGAGSPACTLRSTLALRDVAYIIEAFPLVYRQTAEDTPLKYVAMFNRRVRNGQSFYQPSLGCREFAARFEPPDSGDVPIERTAALGQRHSDIVFRDRGAHNRAIFFSARLEGGVLDTDPEHVIPSAKIREELMACSLKH